MLSVCRLARAAAIDDKEDGSAAQAPGIACLSGTPRALLTFDEAVEMVQLVLVITFFWGGFSEIMHASL